MATTTWNQTFDDKTNYKLTLTVEETGTSLVNNSSTVSYSLVMTSTGYSGYSDYSSTATLKIGGTSLYSGSFSSFNVNPTQATGTKTICSGSTTVQHNDDGTGTATFVAEVKVNRDGGAYSPGNAKISKSLTLTTLARESDISVTSATHYVGASLSISISSNSSAFTHKLRYVIGNKSGDIGTASAGASTYSWTPAFSAFYNASSLTGTIYCKTYNGSSQVGSETSCAVTLTLPVSTISASGTALDSAVTISLTRKVSSITHDLTWKYSTHTGSIDTGVATSKSWTPSSSTFGPYIPTSTSITITILCQCKGSGYNIGSPISTTVTLSLPTNVKPSGSSWASVAYYNTGTAADGIITTYLQGYSKFKVTITSGNITYNGGTSFDHYAVKFNGSTTTFTSSSYTSSTLTTAGSQSVTVYVYDKRGRYMSTTLNFTVQSYAPPTITNASVYRCTSGGTADEEGTYYKVVATLAVSAYSYGNGATNASKIERKVSGGSYSMDVQFAAFTNPKNYTMSPPGGAGNLDITKAYQIRITVVDKLGKSTNKVFDLPPSAVAFNIKDGGAGAAFFGYAQTDGELTVYGDLKYTGRLLSSVVKTISAGSSGVVTMGTTSHVLLCVFGGDTAVNGLYLLSTTSSGTVVKKDISAASGITITTSTNTVNISNTSGYTAYIRGIVLYGTASA